MKSSASLRIVVPLAVVGGGMVLLPLARPTGLVALGVAGIGSVGVGLVVLVAAGVLWRWPPSPGQAWLLAGLSCVATVLGGYPVGVLLGVLAGSTSVRSG
ncbi:hypothetical protein [Streptomyces sp. NPDC051921]|uniref:hypothetical protein n=1 Tax=Streptomyces sp. NPDC051921 TaxID=3155806 RepID=UPI003444C413